MSEFDRVLEEAAEEDKFSTYTALRLSTLHRAALESLRKRAFAAGVHWADATENTMIRQSAIDAVPLEEPKK